MSYFRVLRLKPGPDGPEWFLEEQPKEQPAPTQHLSAICPCGIHRGDCTYHKAPEKTP